MQTVFIEVRANIFRRDLAGINGSETVMPLGKERLFWFFEKGEVTKKAVSGTLLTKISKDLLLDGGSGKHPTDTNQRGMCCNGPSRVIHH